MPWPLQCTHERAEPSVDLVLWALVPPAMCSVLLQDGMPQQPSEQTRQDKTHGEIATQAQGITAGAIHWRGDGSARE